MAVGDELARRTGLKLLHNHVTIELALQFFPFGDPAFYRIVADLRRRVMEEVAASNLPGLIVTYVWALDDPRDKHVVDEWISIFEAQGRQALFVELAASQAVRIERNGTEFRLSQKPSKRDRDASEQRLVALDQRHKLNSTDEFDGADNYLRIDNTNVSAALAAKMICDRFGLAPRPL